MRKVVDELVGGVIAVMVWPGDNVNGIEGVVA